MDCNQGLPQIDLPSKMIHLGLGQPSSHLLPLKEIEKAALFANINLNYLKQMTLQFKSLMD